MHKNLILLGIFLFIISCETTAPLTKITEILPKPTEKIIYQPDDNVSDKSEEILNKKDTDIANIEVQKFRDIEDYVHKNISSVVLKYGDFNFSKKEEIYELHRYNAVKCRIFIQNSTSNQKIISITIYQIEDKKILSSYEKDLCN